jgi:hypothetical protein
MSGADHSSGCGNYGDTKLSPGGEAASFVLNVDNTKIYRESKIYKSRLCR